MDSGVVCLYHELNDIGGIARCSAFSRCCMSCLFLHANLSLLVDNSQADVCSTGAREFSFYNLQSVFLCCTG